MLKGSKERWVPGAVLLAGSLELSCCKAGNLSLVPTSATAAVLQENLEHRAVCINVLGQHQSEMI